MFLAHRPSLVRFDRWQSDKDGMVGGRDWTGLWQGPQTEMDTLVSWCMQTLDKRLWTHTLSPVSLLCGPVQGYLTFVEQDSWSKINVCKQNSEQPKVILWVCSFCCTKLCPYQVLLRKVSFSSGRLLFSSWKEICSDARLLPECLCGGASNIYLFSADLKQSTCWQSFWGKFTRHFLEECTVVALRGLHLRGCDKAFHLGQCHFPSKIHFFSSEASVGCLLYDTVP